MENENLLVAANIIDLILAIKENNLDYAMALVPTLNEYIIDDDNMYVNDMLGLNNLSSLPNNETLIYVIDNLSHIYNAPRIKWILNSEKIISDYQKGNLNNEAIKNFVLEHINNISEYYEYSTLIRMIHFIQDYDLLLLLKERLNIVISSEEG
jgi:hypothetical protein